MSNIRNKTSTVPAEKSISRIELRLARLGASRIEKDYKSSGDAFVDGLSFTVMVSDQSVSYRVPARVQRIYAAMKNARRRRMTAKQDEALFKQAYRTAWKLLWDWVDVQATMIELEQVEAAEVFMPYLIVSGKGETLYEAAIERGNYGRLMLEGNS